MKSLLRVEKIMNVLKVITTVLFVLSIIGASLFLLMTLIIGGSGSDSTVFEEVVKQYIANGILPKDTSTKEAYQLCLATCMSVTLLCISEAVIYYFVKRMYSYVVEIGTPFDKVFVKKMRNVGTIRIVVSIFTLIICSVIVSIMTSNSNSISISNSSSIAMGILYLIVACFFDYGADINHLPDDTNNEENKQNEEQNNNF